MNRILFLLLLPAAALAQPYERGYMTTNKALVQMNPIITSLKTTGHMTNGGDLVFTTDELYSIGSVSAAPLGIYSFNFNFRDDDTPGEFVTVSIQQLTGSGFDLFLPGEQGPAGGVLTNDGIGNLHWWTPATTINAKANSTGPTLTNPTNTGTITLTAATYTEGANGGAFGGYISTNYIDWAGEVIQRIAISNNFVYLATTNRDRIASSQQRNIEVQITPTHFWIATNRNIVLFNGWKRFSGALTNNLASNKVAIVRLSLLGGGAVTEASVAASYEPEL